MKPTTILSSSYKAARLILFAFIVFTIISYLYVIFTGTYNGDYLGIKPKLSQMQLFHNLLYTITPFLVLFIIYKQYKKVNNRYKITIPCKAFGQFLFLVVIFQIIVTALFGVGKLGRDIYEAPATIKLFIQIFNRFDVIFGIAIYSVVAEKEQKNKILLWVLIFILSILRASLGVFAIMGFIMIILYNDYFIAFVKKHLLFIILIITIAPVFVTILYDIRKQMRQEKEKIEISIDEKKEWNFSEVIFGQLVGRLSSYSNSAIIMERKNKMIELTKDFSLMQYPKEAITSVYGKIIDRKKISYPNLLYESAGNHTRNYSAMNGTQGAILIGSYKSGKFVFVNIITILLIVVLAFELTSLLHYDKMYEIVFLFFCFSAMSGGAAEYMSKLMFVVLYLLLFLFFNSLKTSKK